MIIIIIWWQRTSSLWSSFYNVILFIRIQNISSSDWKHLGVSRVGPTTKDNKYWDIIHVFQNELFFQMEKKIIRDMDNI